MCVCVQVLSRPVTLRQLGATLREPGYLEGEFRVSSAVSVVGGACVQSRVASPETAQPGLLGGRHAKGN